ncbi:Crp/Fnr family transcriptional regulator [Segetibacter sp. 3557_3]|uniref:Crp/Fnr family transcriptional regulator n=1 Tax=Segetibacter sp. 3557_3 TaxID=2547429 RepID=UPI001058B31D|nr:Crp/Fnr family transcriptional regulator [Segetibacter sp. 3557_3]TDH24603.1 Crp/Fnr family transcriptional regulator [Segetibacter sp. 3557_3]
MIDAVIAYFNTICAMPDELVDDLRELVRIKDFKKDSFLLKSGQVSNYASWILTGLTRSYYLRDTEEVTTKFLWEGATITSVYSFYSRKPGNENIVAIEDTTVAMLHYNEMQTLYKKHPAFNTIGRVITEKYLYMLEIEVYNLRKQKGEDKYQFIVKHFPHLLQRVPLKYLATYLGMNLETLSRIRGKR